jgi:hypothetical protein
MTLPSMATPISPPGVIGAAGRARGDAFCPNECRLPALSTAFVRSTDLDLAARYALRAGDVRIGSGHALIDAQLRVRYRTFDPELAEHETEMYGVEVSASGLESRCRCPGCVGRRGDDGAAGGSGRAGRGGFSGPARLRDCDVRH